MNTYGYDERRVDQLTESSQRLRARYCIGAAAVLGGAAMVAWRWPELIFGVGHHARLWVLATLLVFFAGPLVENLWRWNSHAKTLRQALRGFRVEVSAEWVRVSAASGRQLLRPQEIRRAEEVPWGLYLRSAERYRWILIPAQINGYEKLRNEIGEMGIPVVPSAMAPNWQEFAGALVLTGTMVAAIFTHSILALTLNLAISIVAAVAGFVVISANPENLPKMRWARLGIFLPVLMTASMLWMALR